MVNKTAMIGNGKKQFSRSRQSIQERMETKKKTFVDQIRKDWKRKKKLLSLTSVKSGKIGNRKN